MEGVIKSTREAFQVQKTNRQLFQRGSDKALDKRIRAFSTTIAKIDDEIAKLNAPFGGDMGYRIERSQYYVRQFREGLPALRIKRVEGYQPYQFFVERRLGPAFSFLNALRMQYDRVMADKASLFQYYLAREAEAVEIATKNRNREIAALQIIADLALWGALLPYYVGTILFEHAYKLNHCDPTSSSIWLYFWGSLALFGGVLATRRLIWPVPPIPQNIDATTGRPVPRGILRNVFSLWTLRIAGVLAFAVFGAIAVRAMLTNAYSMYETQIDRKTPIVCVEEPPPEHPAIVPGRHDPNPIPRAKPPLPRSLPRRQ